MAFDPILQKNDFFKNLQIDQGSYKFFYETWDESHFYEDYILIKTLKTFIGLISNINYLDVKHDKIIRNNQYSIAIEIQHFQPTIGWNFQI